MNELNLSRNMTRLRRERKMTQEAVAVFAGVTKAAVSKWETGQSMPDILLLPRLASLFGVTIDELLGYESQLSEEQIRQYYTRLCQDFARLSFEEAVEKTRALAHKYYACYPFLLQLCILCWNHYMLAETAEEGQELLREAMDWNERILKHCKDVEVCSDALVLKAGLNLQLGQAAEAIEVLEPLSDPLRLAGQSEGLLIRAYQMAGKEEKAKSYVQIRQYLSVLNIVGESVCFLSLWVKEPERCRKIIHRGRGIIDLFRLEELHPNLAAQFYYQAAVTEAVNGRREEALEELSRFAKCTASLLEEEPIELRGDGYFDRLDGWIERLPLGSMAPRDKSFIRQSVWEALSHPGFDDLRGDEEFENIFGRFTKAKS